MVWLHLRAYVVLPPLGLHGLPDSPQAYSPVPSETVKFRGNRVVHCSQASS